MGTHFPRIQLCLSIVIILCSLSCTQKYVWTTTQQYTAYQPALVVLKDFISSDAEYVLIGQDLRNPLAIQQYIDSLWCFIPPVDIPKNAQLSIEVRKDPDFVIPCQISKTSEFIEAKIDTRQILRYAIATQQPADSLPSYYQRSGFIHPLCTRSGEVLTAGFPNGHVHQHGMFHAWTRTFIRDSLIDFWNQQAQLGDIAHDQVISVTNGPVFSSFEVTLDYQAYLGIDTIKTSKELWKITIFPLEEDYLLDWEISHTWLGPDSLVIDKYHYGGTAFRGSEYWNVEEGAYDSLVFIQTNEFKSPILANHSRPTWISMHGATSAKGYGGVAYIPASESFRYPQPVRVHPTMPYFCFAPMVLDKIVLQPDQQYRAAYRILVFDGKPDLKLIEQTLTCYRVSN